MRLMQTIKTKRLLLRVPRESDLDFFIRLYGNRDVMKYIPPKGEPANKQEAEERLKKLIRHWDTHGYGMFLLEWIKTGEAAGYCGLRYLEETDDIELGYIINQPFWRKGIASEAAIECMNYAWDTLKANNLVSVTNPTNKASQNILKKLGFSRHKNLDGMYYGMKHCFFRKEQPHTVIAVILEKDGRYLFTKRSEHEDPAPGYWAPVCGRVEPGESQEEAVKREVKEEVDLEVSARTKICSFPADDNSAILHWWKADILSGDTRVVTDELSETRWVTLGEMKQLTPIFQKNIEVFEGLRLTKHKR